MTAAACTGTGLRAAAAFTPAGGSATTPDYAWGTAAQVPGLLMGTANAYVYGPGLTPAEQVSLATGTITYLVTDSLGSVRGTVSASGALTGATSYDAWGIPTSSGGLTATTPFGFAGAYTDLTGLTYLIHRYYDPATGQFTSADPLVDQTFQLYSYAAGDPVTGTDPPVCAPAPSYAAESASPAAPPATTSPSTTPAEHPATTPCCTPPATATSTPPPPATNSLLPGEQPAPRPAMPAAATGGR